MVTVLVEDARFAMPPYPLWFAGRENVVAFISRTGKLRLRSIPVSASGQPAIGWYLWDSSRENYLPASIEVLAVEGERVKEVTAFASPELFPRFGLPTELSD